VAKGARETLTELGEYIATRLDAETSGLLLKYGFSFDILLKGDGGVQLVEINPFGSMSGCGGCLFHCVLDGKALYGLENAVFATTMYREALMSIESTILALIARVCPEG